MEKLTLAVPLWLLNLLSSWWADVQGFTDWSLFGWAFAGSTVYVLIEIVGNVQRPGLHRCLLIVIGLLPALALTKAVVEKWNTNPVATSFCIALFFYTLFGPAKDFLIKYINSKSPGNTTSPPPVP